MNDIERLAVLERIAAKLDVALRIDRRRGLKGPRVWVIALVDNRESTLKKHPLPRSGQVALLCEGAKTLTLALDEAARDGEQSIFSEVEDPRPTRDWVHKQFASMRRAD